MKLIQHILSRFRLLWQIGVIVAIAACATIAITTTIHTLGRDAEDDIAIITQKGVSAKRAIEVAHARVVDQRFASDTRLLISSFRLEAMQLIQDGSIHANVHRERLGFITQKLKSELGTLQKKMDTPAERELIQTLLAQYDVIARQSEELYIAVRDDELSQAHALDKQIDTAAGNMSSTLDAIIQSLTDEQEEANTNAIAAMDAIHQAAANGEMLIDEMLSVSLVLNIGAIIVIATIGTLLAIAISRPIQQMTHVIGALAAGDLTVTVPSTERRDEVGEMARAVRVCQSGLQEAARLRDEQKAAEQNAAAEKKKTMEQLAATFEASVGNVAKEVVGAAEQMKGAATTLAATADQTTAQATVVAAATEEASSNIQTVAAAAEELAASIGEIARQVATSTHEAGDAARQAEDARTLVESLSQAADKIGAVVGLINDIASQTNLLALNATIEAARAGEAGKGFAVVAHEVKSLATQTSRATEEIGQQIGAVQTATRDAVDAIRGIVAAIGRVNDVTTSVAAAVEEQGAATQEIARNVQQAAVGTQEVANNIDGVQAAAATTSSAVSQIGGSAQHLAGQGATLNTAVQNFLNQLRAG